MFAVDCFSGQGVSLMMCFDGKRRGRKSQVKGRTLEMSNVANYVGRFLSWIATSEKDCLAVLSEW